MKKNIGLFLLGAVISFAFVVNISISEGAGELSSIGVSSLQLAVADGECDPTRMPEAVYCDWNGSFATHCWQCGGGCTGRACPGGN